MAPSRRRRSSSREVVVERTVALPVEEANELLSGFKGRLHTVKVCLASRRRRDAACMLRAAGRCFAAGLTPGWVQVVRSLILLACLFALLSPVVPG